MQPDDLKQLQKYAKIVIDREAAKEGYKKLN